MIKTIEIGGQPVKALFDTGTFQSYVLRKYVEGSRTKVVAKPYEVALGGETLEVREHALVTERSKG